MDELDRRVVRTPPLPRDNPEGGQSMTLQVQHRNSRARDRELERRSRARRSRSRHSRGRSSRITSDGSRSSRRRSRSRSRRSRSRMRLSPAHVHRSPTRSRRSRSRRSRTRSRRSRSRSQSRRHRRSHTRYGDNELLGTLKDLFKAVRSEDRSDHVERFPVMNVLPEFDPANRSQTIDVWLNKVNETASIYNWTERQVIHYALPKLAGVALKWYQGLTSLKHTWLEWQVKLKTAFPSKENYGLLLTEMLEKRAKYGDSLEDYYYEKVMLLNRCRITGTDAVDCILLGIDDRAVKTSAEAAQFTEPDKLLVYLRSQKNTKPRVSSRQTNDSKQVNSRGPKPDNKVVKCFNCGEDGHPHFKCKQPIKKCETCSRIGHVSSDCNTKKNFDAKNEKTVS
ncbi:uncharacterized protein LOC133528369 [Cydia pomonella]|uniref:uncharacterized protein LOC133528369 n=1 Tax=Cydia pomonella TaxID=82600 RepID=UPI002ADD6493|nr:uncharacterized protein LOC133528369 [Cydia pomonella]